MKVLLTGASGLVGRALAPRLVAEGHSVVALRRRPLGGPGVQATWNPEAGQIDLSQSGPLDAVIHLAGETIAQRWTEAAKARIRDSRVRGTRLLCEALAGLPHLPRALVCASATGFYGDRGEEVLDEESPPGVGFLAGICRDWEAATAPALAHGVRVVHLRLGVVLAAQGGALARMLPVFRLGWGGPLGSGRQHWSWIEIGDLASAFQHVLKHEELSGPINAVAPNPVTNREFARTLAVTLGRPAILPVPAWAVKLLLGEMGEEALLASARVTPRKLKQTGFVFAFPELASALRQALRT
jgi:uncharacterized protein